jgi:hypothetical protein
MPDDRMQEGPSPKKRPQTGKARRKDRAGEVADLDDAEISEKLLGSKWVEEPAERPAWLKALRWLALIVCVVVFPLGLCVLCTWLMCRFPPASVQHRLRGVKVLGRVVANQEGFGSAEDGPTYRAIVEYTFKGVPYTTPDGPVRNRWQWRIGEKVVIHHIHESFEPGRYVPPGVLGGYGCAIVVLNVVVLALGIWAAARLWNDLKASGVF